MGCAGVDAVRLIATISMRLGLESSITTKWDDVYDYAVV